MRGTSVPDEPLSAPGAGSAVARGAALRVGAYALGQALALGAAALLFRHLGVDDAGRYVTVLALVSIVQGLAEAGLGTMAARELTVRPSAELLGRLLGVRLVLSAAGVAIAVGFAALAGYEAAMVAGTAIAGIGAVAVAAQSTLAAALLARVRAGTVAVAELARQATGLALIAAGVLAGAGLAAFFGAYALSGLVALAVTAGAVRARPRLDGARELLRGVLPFAVAATASVLFFRVALIEMSLIGDAHETGLFAVSFRIVEVLIAVPALAVGTGFPLLAKRAAAGDREGVMRAVRKAERAMGALGVTVAAGLAIAAPLIVRIVGGDDFADAGPVLRIQGLALAFSFVAAPSAYALLGLGRERALAWANAVGVACALAIAAPLIDAHGAKGAALATVLGEAGLAITFALLLSRTPAPPDRR